MPETSAAALRIEGLDVHYGFVKALHGVDFHVMPGEVVGLVGDNGAGKSTLLKVISGTNSPTLGTISRCGEPVTFHAPKDAASAGVQMVYQDLALVDSLDVAVNMCLGQEILRKGILGKLGFIDRRAMRREAARELDALGSRRVNDLGRAVEMLSGGQRQVVALARASVRVGQATDGVLLLDEPTAALGYEQTRQVRGLIRQLAAKGIAIVLVTHDLSLCFESADRIVVLNRGQKVADVATKETDRESVVGWITGAKAPQPGLEREEAGWAAPAVAATAG